MDKLVVELRAEAVASQRYGSAIVDTRANIYSRAADALAIAQKRVNELEAALENAADELEDAADSFDAVKMSTCATCAAKASREARAALPTMLKGNGDG